MLSTLPRPVAAYIQASNAHDSAALTATFSDDAVISDDAHEYRGQPAILAWNTRNVKEYASTMTVTEAVERAGTSIVTAQVAGTFPGIPLPFRSTFTCAGDEITSLHIEYIG